MNHDPAKVVEGLLDRLKREDPDNPTPPNTPKSINVSSLHMDFSEIDTPEDLAAVCSLFISLIGTVVASSHTGMSQAVRKDIFPQTAKHLRENDGGVKERHVKFVRSVIDPALKRIEDDHQKKAKNEFNAPIQVASLVNSYLAFGLAMHALGRKGEDVPFENGLPAALHKGLTRALSSGGLQAHEGDFPELLEAYIEQAIKDVRAAAKKAAQDKDSQDG